MPASWLEVESRCTFEVKIKEKATPDMTWIEPNLVCNIKFSEITDEGSVRHPVFKGLRVDKTANEVQFEKPRVER